MKSLWPELLTDQAMISRRNSGRNGYSTNNHAGLLEWCLCPPVELGYMVTCTRVSGIFQKLDLEADHLPRTGHIPQKPPNKISDLCELFSGVAMRFCVYKGISEEIQRILCYLTIFALILFVSCL